MKAGDRRSVGALRSALAAIDNAEAVHPEAGGGPGRRPAGGGPIAGAATGLGATEVDRKVLTEEEVADVVRAEMTERTAAAAEYDRLGRSDRAAELRAEAAVLAAHLAV